MKLQGRSLLLLSPMLQGDDVKLLQGELQQLGFNIAAAEVASQTFDQSTSAAVRNFQSKNSLPITGVVDEATAAKIDAAVDALREQSFVVVGQVCGADGKPVAALTVRAFDKDIRGENSLGETKTNEQGSYRIEYTAAQFRRSDKERGGPELIVRVFDENGSMLVASHMIRSAGPAEKVDLVTGTPSATSFIVRGQVRQADGSLFVGAEVLAFDKDLRREESLGHATTDREGRYQISYTAEQFRRSEKKSADLIVRVFANGDPSSALVPPDGKFPPDGESISPASISDSAVAVTAPSLETAAAEAKPLVSSPVIFNARPIETVDLMVGGEQYKGPSEYELLVAELTPLMQDPLVRPNELTPEDVVFLSGETGLDARHITFFGEAARLSAKTELPPEVFYGFARENLSTDLSSLLAQHPQVLRLALERALDSNIIPLRLRASLDSILERLRWLVVENALQGTGKPGTFSLGEIIGTVISDKDLLRDFLTAYFARKGAMADFWSALRKDARFAPLVPVLQRTLQLKALTLGHLPLIKFLQAEFHSGSLTSVSDLTTRSERDWLAIINNPDPGNGQPIGTPPDVTGEPAEKAANYAGILTNAIAAAFPTEVVANRIPQTTIDGQSDLLTFFAQNRTFDIRQNIDAYLAERAALGSIDDAEKLTDNLKAIQRLSRISPHVTEIQALLSLPQVRSAYDIVTMGKDEFTSQLTAGAGSELSHTRATQLYERAEQVHDTALALYGKYAETMNIAHTPFAPMPIPVHAQSQIPNYTNLFGTVDFCECEHCRSVFSPAAYLVDLLALLDTVRVNNKKATEFLFTDSHGNNRRGDIGEIELTCQNTNTPLPYIDLVNEILEYAVDANKLPTLQTTRSADELLVSPEHVHADAYDVHLARAVYPWDLPFNLAVEQARTFLEHLGVPRYELMETFQQQARLFVPDQYEIAAECLGLTRVERELINGTRTNDPWECWGLKDKNNLLPDPTDPQKLNQINKDWIDVLAFAFYFLERSQLSQQQFLELLDTEFVRGLGGLSLNWPGADCFMDKATIGGLDSVIAGKLHRFLRLRLKLGWSVAELDQVVRVLAGGNLDDAFLLRISYLQRLRAEFDLSLSEMLSWWGLIETKGSDGKPSLYEQLFLINPVDTKLNLNGNRDELEHLTESITDHIPAVAAGLGVSATDINLLQLNAAPLPITLLNLSNLSLLYRSVSFTRALRLSISEFISLRVLSGIIDPLASIEDTWRFVETARKVRGSGFTIPEVDYLLRHAYTDSSGVAPTVEEITLVLTDIRTGLQKIAKQTAEASFALPVSEGYVKKRISEALELEAKVAQSLLELEITPTRTLLMRFIDDSFIWSTQDIAEQPSFRPQFDAFRWLHKAAILIRKFRITSDEIDALLLGGSSAGWLDLRFLPLQPWPPVGFPGWERWLDLFALRASLPRVGLSLFDIFAVKLPPKLPVELFKKISQLTGWPEDEIQEMVAGLGLDVAKDFQDERGLIRLKAAFDLLKRLGVPISKALDWRSPDLFLNQADEIKNAVKAHYDLAQWFVIARPWQDVSRQKQRDALVSFLTARDRIDVNQLFDHYLIDVEMSPCQLTSRIKQAIGSVQLFIQRAAMNLEPPVKLGEKADEWKTWMRTYRVWEANRKIFLYPENWVEPALLPNKTPFFKALENDLAQSDITPDRVETAFLNYLEKLDTVALLDVRGLCNEVVEVDKNNNILHDHLHVFARTQGTPHIYYYRRRVDSRYWTPWEKVELDITGDHLIPVVHDSRLKLFWALFTEKPDESTTLPSKDKPETPQKHFEIQLAWSEYKNGKWAAKKVTKEHIRPEESGLRTPPPLHPDPDPTLEFFFSAMTGLALKANAPGFSGDDTDLCILCRQKAGVFTYTGWFIFNGYEGGVVTRNFGSSFRLRTSQPMGTLIRGMECVENVNETMHSDALFLPGSTSSDLPVMNQTPGTFRLSYLHDSLGFSSDILFYQDGRQDYLVLKSIGNLVSSHDWADTENAGLDTTDPEFKLYQFLSFYHPYVREFIQRLNHEGIDGLFAKDQQLLSPQTFPDETFFNYGPVAVVKPYPIEDVDFTFRGAYSQYNWELFFHAPLLVAERLSQNQRFEDAQKWFHYIFDPTDPDISQGVENAWQFRPFRNVIQRPIDELMALLDYTDTDPKLLAERKEIEDLIEEWRKDPFDPHLIARHRLSAYQKTVVMKYLDNLIAWGDQLFRQDTIETINQATQLYVLAAEILGKRPRILPQRFHPKVQTYNQLAKAPLDKFSNALVQIENWVPPSGGQQGGGIVPLGKMLYFCIPGNDKLLGYWDTVADRLFKIRHCMNIEGIVRELPLFEPPIDPGLLVRAKAAGVDLTSALKDVTVSLPNYRFTFMLQKALEFCADVKSLGASLLSALEKRDAEALALLRSGHEVSILKAVRQIKERQIDEANATLEGLMKSREVIQTRYEYYRDIAFMNPQEKLHLELMAVSALFQDIGTHHEAAAALAHWIPNFEVGIAGFASSPENLVGFGGTQIGGALQAFATSMRGVSAALSTAASMSATMGSFQRRDDEWKLQERLAAKELEQIEKQIIAAQIRLEVAQNELANHDRQIQNAEDVDSFMHDKFTNQELYDWMVTQVATIYFQSYQLAYDLAKRAEKAYQFERCNPQASFIQFGYWDSLKKGLLAGERLHYDLRRMDGSYLDQHKREYEISKHISLVFHDPMALISLKESGQCILNLPEAIFDMDYPGHYMRRIKNVTLTIPCVVGPYTNVNCTLTLLDHKIRIDKYPEDYSNSRHLVTNSVATQSITTSHAQNDSGLFELNFRDERYLPFEGAGVDSNWQIEMPKDCNAFDFGTISDVIINLNYTAREGGKALGIEARKAAILPAGPKQQAPGSPSLQPKQANLLRFFSLKHEFSNEWYRFLHPTAGADKQTLQLDLIQERFPFLFRRRTIEVALVEIFLKFKDIDDPDTFTKDPHNPTPLGDYATTNALRVNVMPPKSAKVSGTLNALSFGLPHANFSWPNPPLTPLPGVGVWTLEANAADVGTLTSTLKTNDGKHLNPEVVEDIYMVCHYSVS